MGIGDSAGLEAAKLYKPVVDKFSNQTSQALVQLKFYGETIDKRASEFIQQVDELTNLFNQTIYMLHIIRKSTEMQVETILSEFNRTREFFNDNLVEAIKLGFFISGCFIQIFAIVVYLLMNSLSRKPNKANKRTVLFEEIIESMQTNVTCSYMICIIILMINILLYSSCYSLEVFSLISASSTLCFWIFFSFQVVVDVFSRFLIHRPFIVLVLSLLIALILDTCLILVYKLNFFGNISISLNMLLKDFDLYFK